MRQKQLWVVLLLVFVFLFFLTPHSIAGVASITKDGENIVDELSDAFQTGCNSSSCDTFWEESTGYGSHMYWTYAVNDAVDGVYANGSYGKWSLNVVDAGNYEVFAYIPSANATSIQATYKIWRANVGEDYATINQYNYSNEWVSLGTFYFGIGDAAIRLNDNTGESYLTYERQVGFDAIKLVNTDNSSGLPAPDLNSPINGSTDVSLSEVMAWDNVLNSTLYRIQITEDSEFNTSADGTDCYNCVLNETNSINEYQVQSSEFNYGKQYKWRVRAGNSDSGGYWSSAWSFTTMQDPNTPPPSTEDKAEFVSDGDYPDNTEFVGGTTFTKEWTIKNSGTTTWNSGYKLRYISGELSTDQSNVNIVGTVSPGSSYTFSVSMQAPAVQNMEQTYTEYWEFLNSDGNVISVDNADSIWAKITVPAEGTQPPPQADGSWFPFSDGFDYPFEGNFSSSEWHDVQDFGVNNHLGEDWNFGGGSDDLNKPIYSIANGKVIYARDAGTGWNGVIIIEHYVPATGETYCSFYGHLDKDKINDWVEENDWVYRGEQIGIIGPTASGSEAPHLHFEMRTVYNIDPGPGYSSNRTGWTDPSDFIDANLPDTADVTSLMRTYRNENIINAELNKYYVEMRGSFIKILVDTLENLSGKTLSTDGSLNFSDVSEQDWYYESLLKAWNLGILDTPEGGDFNPNQPITRGDALAFTVAAYEAYSGTITSQASNAFVDVVNGEYYDIVQKGYSAELTSGYLTAEGRYFYPERWVPRGEAVAFIEKLNGKLNNPGTIGKILNAGIGIFDFTDDGQRQKRSDDSDLLGYIIKDAHKKLHRTENYKDHFVLRRSLPVTVFVLTEGEVALDLHLMKPDGATEILVDGTDDWDIKKTTFSNVLYSGFNVIYYTVLLKKDLPIGKYQFSINGQVDTEEFYVIFNPFPDYSESDDSYFDEDVFHPDVYQAIQPFAPNSQRIDSKQLDAYVNSEKTYRYGSIPDYYTKKYERFSKDNTKHFSDDVFGFMIERFENKQSAKEIARDVSRLAHEILEGNWGSKPYDCPSDFSLGGSSISCSPNNLYHNSDYGKILEYYQKKDKKGVLFGQCYSFAELSTALLRSLGIPSRVVGNDRSGMDVNYDDKIKFDYNVDTDFSCSNDYQWYTGHYWTEVWLPHDYGGSKHGWCAIDGTPNGCGISEEPQYIGPAPIIKIKNFKLAGETANDGFYDEKLFYSMVNTPVYRYNQAANKWCKVRNYASHGMSAFHPNNPSNSTNKYLDHVECRLPAYFDENYGDIYKFTPESDDPNFCPKFSGNTVASNEILCEICDHLPLSRKRSEPRSDDLIRAGFTEEQYVMGDDIVVSLEIDNPFDKPTTFYYQIAVLNINDANGGSTPADNLPLINIKDSITIEAGSSFSDTMEIPASEYMTNGEFFLDVNISESETLSLTILEDRCTVEGITISTADDIQVKSGETFEFSVTITNPLDEPITDTELAIISPDNFSTDEETVIVIPNLEGRESYTHSITFTAAGNGIYQITAVADHEFLGQSLLETDVQVLGEPELRIRMETVEEVEIANSVNVKLTVRNIGGQAAENVVVNFKSPELFDGTALSQIDIDNIDGYSTYEHEWVLPSTHIGNEILVVTVDFAQEKLKAGVLVNVRPVHHNVTVESDTDTVLPDTLSTVHLTITNDGSSDDIIYLDIKPDVSDIEVTLSEGEIELIDNAVIVPANGSSTVQLKVLPNSAGEIVINAISEYDPSAVDNVLINIISEAVEEDSDSDGLPDAWEQENFGNLDQDQTTDFDNDGISDGDEYNYDLDPTIDDSEADADGDGYTNLEEIENGTDLNDPDSHPAYAIIECDYSVPADYTTIQSGIDAAHTAGGGIVCVSPGTYAENITLKDGVWLVSESRDPADTIIQGGGKKDVVVIEKNDAGGIMGFTITGSGTNGNFAGIDVNGNDDTPTIANCVIKANNNGIVISGNSDPEIVNNVITDNTGDGIRCNGNSEADIYNNIIVSNGDDGISQNGQLTLRINYNDIWNNDQNNVSSQGDISQDPLFVSPETGNFHLASGSPCIDTGNPEIQDRDSSRSDMGVYGGNMNIENTETSDPSEFDSGIFTADATGKVSIDFSFDGGGYQGQLGVFSMAGMDAYVPNSPEFIAEAAQRALSGDPDEGFVVISDPDEGARFSGYLGDAHDFNDGPYLGIKEYAMTPGTQFAVFLVPNGTVQQVADNPGTNDPRLRPLFSLASSNADHGMYMGQVADLFGTDRSFAYEDLVFSNSDFDFDDVIFYVEGATCDIPSLDDLIAQNIVPKKPDWLDSDLGDKIREHAETEPVTAEDTRITITVSISVSVTVVTPDGLYCSMADGSIIPGAILKTDDQGNQTISLPTLADGEYELIFTGTGDNEISVSKEKGDGTVLDIQTAIVTFEEDQVSVLDIPGTEDGEIPTPEPEPVTSVITATAGQYGNIEPSGQVIVNEGDNQTFAITPESHCHITDVIVDGESQGAITEFTFEDVSAPHTIEANFEIEQVTVTIVTQGNGDGTLSEETQQVPYGSDFVVLATPADGSIFEGWSGDASGTGVAVLTDIISDVEIVATFTRITDDEIVITATTDGCASVEPSGNVAVKQGESQTFVIGTPDDCHTMDVMVDGESKGDITEYTFEDVSAPHEIKVVCEVRTFTVTIATTGDGSGTLSHATQTVNCGSDLTVIATPDTDSVFNGWSGDFSGAGNAVLTNIISDMTLTADFGIKTVSDDTGDDTNSDSDTGDTTDDDADSDTDTDDVTDDVVNDPSADDDVTSTDDDDDADSDTDTDDATDGVVNDPPADDDDATADDDADSDTDTDDVTDDVVNDPSADDDATTEDDADSDYPTKLSIMSVTGTGEITVDTSSNDGTWLADIQAISEDDENGIETPEGYTFPHGFVAFSINTFENAQTIQVRVEFPQDIPEDAVCFKKDSTGFYELTDVAFDGSVAILTLTDGGSGDNDGVADGVITDEMGIAITITDSENADTAVEDTDDNDDDSSTCFINTAAHNSGIRSSVIFLILISALAVPVLRKIKVRMK